MSEREQSQSLPDLPAVEPVDAQAVRGGFDPQPDPPKLTNGVSDPSALLLPAVQKVREAAARMS